MWNAGIRCPAKLYNVYSTGQIPLLQSFYHYRVAPLSHLPSRRKIGRVETSPAKSVENQEIISPIVFRNSQSFRYFKNSFESQTPDRIHLVSKLPVSEDKRVSSALVFLENSEPRKQSPDRSTFRQLGLPLNHNYAQCRSVCNH